MFAAWLRTQPLRVQGVAIALIILANHAAATLGLTLGGLCETAIDVVAVLAATEITRRHVTPTPRPRAAVPPAHQETRTMSIEEFEAAAKAVASKALAVINNLLAANPALEDAAKAGATDALGDLAALGQTEVQKVLPPTAAEVVDGLIADAQTAGDAEVERYNAQIATSQARTAQTVATLQALKPASAVAA